VRGSHSPQKGLHTSLREAAGRVKRGGVGSTGFVEALIFDRALGEPEIHVMEKYLSTQYSLPVSH